MQTPHPNKNKIRSLAECIAAAIRNNGWHRFDRRELELFIKRPLTQLERKAFCMAADGWNNHLYQSKIARMLPSRYGSSATAERRYAAIRDTGYERIRRLKNGKYKMKGSAERSLDLISDQGAAITLTKRDDTGTKFVELSLNEPAIDTALAHRWEMRPYMNVTITRSAIGTRFIAVPGKAPKLHPRLPIASAIGQSRYDGHRMPSARPAIANELQEALTEYLNRGGEIQQIPVGKSGKPAVQAASA